jgi:hypothetical protein
MTNPRLSRERRRVSLAVAGANTMLNALAGTHRLKIVSRTEPISSAFWFLVKWRAEQRLLATCPEFHLVERSGIAMADERPPCNGFAKRYVGARQGAHAAAITTLGSLGGFLSQNLSGMASPAEMWALTLGPRPRGIRSAGGPRRKGR